MAKVRKCVAYIKPSRRDCWDCGYPDCYFSGYKLACLYDDCDCDTYPPKLAAYREYRRGVCVAACPLPVQLTVSEKEFLMRHAIYYARFHFRPRIASALMPGKLSPPSHI